jgi:hypothetical protein
VLLLIYIFDATSALTAGAGAVITKADIFPLIAARGAGQVLLVSSLVVFLARNYPHRTRTRVEYRLPMSPLFQNRTDVFHRPGTSTR